MTDDRKLSVARKVLANWCARLVEKHDMTRQEIVEG